MPVLLLDLCLACALSFIPKSPSKGRLLAREEGLLSLIALGRAESWIDCDWRSFFPQLTSFLRDYITSLSTPFTSFHRGESLTLPVEAEAFRVLYQGRTDKRTSTDSGSGSDATLCRATLSPGRVTFVPLAPCPSRIFQSTQSLANIYIIRVCTSVWSTTFIQRCKDDSC